MSDPTLFKTTYEEEIYSFGLPTTVVLNSKWTELAEGEVQLLGKILASVRLSLAAVRIVEAQKLDLSQWNDKPAKLIGFGVTVTGVNLYEVVTTPQTQLVLAESLGILLEDDDKKKRLWIGLKQLFFPPQGS
jgi:hypothetical protein